MNSVIREASSERDYEAFAHLIREYVTWLRGRYEDDDWLITEVFDKQSLASELENLRATYSAPKGRAFVAVEDDEVRGCGAYRQLAHGICEMKRVFVPQRFQGSGIGRRICNELLASARNDGYQLMRLDTGSLMKEAISMYRSLGFRECAPYYEYPQKLMPHFLFMELSLVEGATNRGLS